MNVQLGFTVENGADIRDAFAITADHGFDFVELNMDLQFDLQHQRWQSSYLELKTMPIVL